MSDNAKPTEVFKILEDYAEYKPDVKLMYLMRELGCAILVGEASECEHCIRENVGLPVDGECAAE